MADGIDWDAGEEHFIRHTDPRVGYREYSAMTAELSWTGFTHIFYDKLKDYGKGHLWWSKRAEYFREHNQGLVRDAELSYGLVMSKIVEEGDTMTTPDLARLLDLQIKLQNLILEHKPADERVEPDSSITRDEVIQIVDGHTPSSKDELLDLALTGMAEETPG